MPFQFSLTPLRLVASLALLSATLLGAPAPKPRPTPVPVRPVGLYSNLAYIPEAGDVVGTEIFILYGGGQHWALLQLAQGEPDEPVLVPASVSGSLVEFAFPQYGENAHFKGRATSRGLEGTISGIENVITVKLLRQRSYWQGK
jgi:hypothetical protein